MPPRGQLRDRKPGCRRALFKPGFFRLHHAEPKHSPGSGVNTVLWEETVQGFTSAWRYWRWRDGLGYTGSVSNPSGRKPRGQCRRSVECVRVRVRVRAPGGVAGRTRCAPAGPPGPQFPSAQRRGPARRRVSLQRAAGAEGRAAQAAVLYHAQAREARDRVRLHAPLPGDRAAARAGGAGEGHGEAAQVRGRGVGGAGRAGRGSDPRLRSSASHRSRRPRSQTGESRARQVKLFFQSRTLSRELLKQELNPSLATATDRLLPATSSSPAPFLAGQQHDAEAAISRSRLVHQGSSRCPLGP